MSSFRQDGPVPVPANEAGSRIEDVEMSVTARREDIFAKPVLITVRGWFCRPLPQIRCGHKALPKPRRLPVAANDP